MVRNRKRVEEAREYTLGPIPPVEFIDNFLSPVEDRGGMMSSKGAFKNVPQRADTPAEIYRPLAAALNRKSKNKARCPGLVFEATIERSSRPLRLGYAKPHISCFVPANANLIQRADSCTRDEFGYAEFFINIVADPSIDFFADPPTDVSADSSTTHQFVRAFPRDLETLVDKSERAFGLHLAFAAEVLARQHRLFLFSISMHGTYARFFRWDRAGCVVSRAFDIRDQPDILVEFLWRFSQASPEERGHDLTVDRASQAEETLFRDAIRAHIRSQLDVDGSNLDKAATAHYQPGHVSVIHVHTGTEASAVRFVISRPVVSPLSLWGRGTRGYWAVCSTTGKVVFLKDTWRAYPDYEIEGNVLQRLNELDVRNVPVLVAHGDVQDDPKHHSKAGFAPHRTQTHRFVEQPWACAIDGKDIFVCKRQHYRLVTGTVGYGLKSVRGTEELLYSTYDAFIAMKDALVKDNRLHRDLSVGNVILVKEPGRTVRRGCLIDWDASAHIDEAGEAVYPGRAGTWDFLSIRMLNTDHEGLKHTIQDDMESMLYLVLYCGLFYLAHDLCMVDLTSFIKSFFREIGRFHGTTCGGDAKAANSVRRRFTSRVHFGSPALQEWLDNVMNFHSPPPENQETFREKWNPESLDTFWSGFLQSRTLERDDRVVHKLSMSGYYDPYSPATTTSSASEGDTGDDDSTSIGKHGRETPDSFTGARDSKRARTTAVPVVSSPPTLPLAIASHSLPTVTPCRRSERLRKKKEVPNQKAPSVRLTRTKVNNPTSRGVPKSRARASAR
ncbi:hypothetical protein C8Q78DRAFT_974397 [Trametes maxima]|nr:hypothetical protein C8Q78DRAFT_974397 [Trametes maxima]